MKPRVWDHYDRVKAKQKAEQPTAPVATPPPTPVAPPPKRHSRDKVDEAAAIMVAAAVGAVTKRDPEVTGAYMIEAARSSGYSLQDCMAALGRLVNRNQLRRGERGFFAPVRR